MPVLLKGAIEISASQLHVEQGEWTAVVHDLIADSELLQNQIGRSLTDLQYQIQRGSALSEIHVD